MASGSVPIVSNCTSLPEVVAGSGVMVDPFKTEELEHALLEICNNEALRKRLSAQAIEQSVRFKWERAAHLALNVLEQAAA
jgi:glycosyltransferase involved in cell wall biosynthesis